MKTKIKNGLYAIISVVITLLLCKHFTSMGTTTWYVATDKPIITPPNYVFPIAWNILYVLLAISFYKILSSTQNNAYAKRLYIGQLALQVLWCYAFFGNQLLIMGAVILFSLNIFAFKMFKEFQKINKAAANMLVPYCIWILFAFILNLAFVI